MRAAILLPLCICFALAGAQSQYGLVIDAGSTGSRIIGYSWDARSFPAFPPPVTTPIQFFVYSNRLADTRVATPQGRQGLRQLLEIARTKMVEQGVSSDIIKATPLFLKATAGMRVLTNSDRVSAMSDVRNILAAGPFQFKPNWARTISGEEEGVAGWIAVNYNAGLLPGQSTATGTTIGALDLGGASTQISFEPPVGVDIMSSQFDVRLTSAAQVSLYTHSFLYYGSDEAIRRINELVVISSTSGAGATIPHPCFLAGSPGVNFTSLIAGGWVNFTGTSNWTACKEFVTPLMLRDAQCLTDPKPTSWPQLRAMAPSGITALDWTSLQEQRLAGALPLPVINPNIPGSSCSIGGQYQPPLMSSFADVRPVRFAAFSAFSRVYDALGLRRDGPLSDLRSSSAVFCNMDFATAYASFPSARGPFFNTYCIQSVYAETLLVEGYGLNTTAPGIVTALPTDSISWTLGSMLYEVNGLPFSFYTRDQTTAVIALAVSLGVVLLGAFIFAIFMRRRWPAKEKRKLNTLLT